MTHLFSLSERMQMQGNFTIHGNGAAVENHPTAVASVLSILKRVRANAMGIVFNKTDKPSATATITAIRANIKGIARPGKKIVTGPLVRASRFAGWRPDDPRRAAIVRRGPPYIARRGFRDGGLRASGQTARINALSAGPGACGGGVTLEFYAAEGALLKRTVIPNLEPGKAAFLDLSRDELPKSMARTQVRAVLRFGYAGGSPPDRETLRIVECNMIPSLEIFESATGRTVLVLTDARPLPGPNPPLK